MQERPRLLKSLGYLKSEGAYRPKLKGVYCCPYCEASFIANTTNINTGNTKRCGTCAKTERAKSRTKWTYEKLKNESALYKTRKEFKSKSPNAYSSARKRGLLDDICSHMNCGKTKWTRELIEEEAAKYEYRNDFQSNSGGAYVAARKMGIIDEVCLHMLQSKFSCDNDVVYIWQVLKEGNPCPIYKVGVTSNRLKKKRIVSCASDANLKYKILIMAKVIDARRIEKRLLSMGVKVDIGHFNGSSEFISMNNTELDVAITLIEAERGSANKSTGGRKNAIEI